MVSFHHLSPQKSLCSFPLSHSCSMPRSFDSSSFAHPHNIWWVQFIKFPVTSSLPLHCTLSLLWPNIFSSPYYSTFLVYVSSWGWQNRSPSSYTKRQFCSTKCILYHKKNIFVFNICRKFSLFSNCAKLFQPLPLNRLTPNDPYMGRTAPLTSKHYILYIYSTNIYIEYFKHALYSPFFFLFKMQFVS